jgi:hypothetical protein
MAARARYLGRPLRRTADSEPAAGARQSEADRLLQRRRRGDHRCGGRLDLLARASVVRCCRTVDRESTESEHAGLRGAGPGPAGADAVTTRRLPGKLMQAVRHPQKCARTSQLRCQFRPRRAVTATYSLVKDAATLDAVFNDAVAASTRVTCPGNIQSPVLCPTGVSNTVSGIGSATMGATIAR